jgi:uncharacterized membrane-anchored protein YhcB (DUF1043 family)
MDSPKKKVRIEPLSLESEFRVLSIKRRLPELSREELEEFLTEALTLMTKLAHQVKQLKEHLDTEEG